MQKIFCDLCGKELEKTFGEVLTHLDEPNGFENKKRALRVIVCIEANEYKGDGSSTSKLYKLSDTKELCAECGKKLKTKIKSTIEEFLQGADKNEKDTHVI